MKLVELRPKEADPQIVDWIKELLTKAEKGQIVGIAGITIGDEETRFHIIPNECLAHAHLQVSSLARALLNEAEE